MGPPKLLVHDFAGHPFQFDLSRGLAERGFEIIHVYCPDYRSGKGEISCIMGMDVLPIPLGATFVKYSAGRRLVQEIRYGIHFSWILLKHRPEIVISCNDPLLAKLISAATLSLLRIPWVYWLQDIYSIAMTKVVQDRRMPMSASLARLFQGLETYMLRSADAIIAITPDFNAILEEWEINNDKVVIIENWAPIAELPSVPRNNEWRRQMRLGDDPIFLYSGTLGLKHNPDLLYDLADALGPMGAKVVVVSEGQGAERLKSLQSDRNLSNLVLLNFQPYDLLPQIMGAADVLLVLLEADAGIYSVPSKILTYLCAGRPLLGAMPADNLASKTIRNANAGVITPPDSVKEFVHAANLLLEDPTYRSTLGKNAREYAERTFDREAILDRFDSLLNSVAGHLDP
jgi:colanic acid biosynthesis glycosyl transferase WcaI